MEYPKKVWVIDVPLPFPFGNAQIRREQPALPPPAFGGAGKADPKAEAKSKRQAKAKKEDPAARQHSRWHIAFAYGLGPLYPLLTGWTFGNIVWAVIGFVAIGACAAMVLYRTEFLARAQASGLGLPALLGGVAGVILVGITAWARALAIAGWRMQQRTPIAIRHPALVTGLGLAVPGSGLFLSGHPRRGALAFWMLGPLMIGALILMHAPWLWRLNQGLTVGRIPRSALELTFLAAVLSVLGAALYWLVQAMDGARHVSRMTGRVSHGQPVALALLTALVVFAGMSKPVQVGEMLDRFAVALRLDGLRVVPLVMELGAAKLDPSQPMYALRAAELYDRLGQRDRAQELRQELESNWNAYARTVETAALAKAAAATEAQTKALVPPAPPAHLPPTSAASTVGPLPAAFPGVTWPPHPAADPTRTAPDPVPTAPGPATSPATKPE